MHCVLKAQFFVPLAGDCWANIHVAFIWVSAIIDFGVGRYSVAVFKCAGVKRSCIRHRNPNFGTTLIVRVVLSMALWYDEKV